MAGRTSAAKMRAAPHAVQLLSSPPSAVPFLLLAHIAFCRSFQNAFHSFHTTYFTLFSSHRAFTTFHTYFSRFFITCHNTAVFRLSYVWYDTLSKAAKFYYSNYKVSLSFQKWQSLMYFLRRAARYRFSYFSPRKLQSHTIRGCCCFHFTICRKFWYRLLLSRDYIFIIAIILPGIIGLLLI